LRILVTGCNAPHVGSARTPLKYVTGARVLTEAMSALGHDVEWRGVIAGEQLTHDFVVIYFGPPTALTAQHLYGALWAYHLRPDAIVAIDDWQTREIVNGFATASRNHQRIWKDASTAGHHIHKYGREQALANKDAIGGALDSIAASGFGREIWASAFPGGDIAALGVRAPSYWGFDPSGRLWDRYPIVHVSDEDRSREWVFANLLDKMHWLKNLGAAWPITCYGNRKLQQPRLPEVGIFQEYARCWGVLGSPYYHTLKGSRWWRPRFVLAANAGAISVGEPGEVGFLGSPYRVSVSEVEAMGVPLLRELADAQRAALLARIWSWDQLRDELAKKLNGAGS
jgi:hypothetical protein